MVSWKRL